MGVLFIILIWYLIIGLVAGRLADRIIGGHKRERDAVAAGALGAIVGGTWPLVPGSALINVVGVLIIATLAAILVLFLFRRSGQGIRAGGERQHGQQPI